MEALLEDEWRNIGGFWDNKVLKTSLLHRRRSSREIILLAEKNLPKARNFFPDTYRRVGLWMADFSEIELFQNRQIKGARGRKPCE